jgi:hypothetical protein
VDGIVGGVGLAGGQLGGDVGDERLECRDAGGERLGGFVVAVVMPVIMTVGGGVAMVPVGIRGRPGRGGGRAAAQEADGSGHESR